MAKKKTAPRFSFLLPLVILAVLPFALWTANQKTNILGQAFFTGESIELKKGFIGPPVIAIEERESFEKDLGGWEKGAWMPAGRAWSLNRVTEKKPNIPKPYDGQWEIAAYQNGSGDDGTVWLTKAFQVRPNSEYRVNLSFYLWSPGRSDINQWSVVSYAGLVKPRVERSEDQWRIFEVIGQTNEIAGWKQYSYRKTVVTGPKNSTIWLAFGQHVLWETERTYFWDLVEIKIEGISSPPTATPTPKPITK